MPTVFRVSGLRVVIYPNDHRSAHVHVKGASSEAVFNLHCPEGPPKLRENYGFSLPELGRIKQLILTELAMLCLEWRNRHGNY